MSNAARKARKKAGIKAPVKAPKIGTPPEERAYLTQPVPGPGGTMHENYTKPRSAKKAARFLERFTPSSSE